MIEKLSIAALRHLTAVIVFVVDLTEHCGTSVEDQLELRDDLRERFLRPDVPWIDVLSKEDLHSSFQKEDQYAAAVSDHLNVSVVSKTGLKELKAQFTSALMTLTNSGETTK